MLECLLLFGARPVVAPLPATPPLEPQLLEHLNRVAELMRRRAARATRRDDRLELGKQLRKLVLIGLGRWTGW